MIIGNTNAPDTSGVTRFEGRGSDPTGANDIADGALYYNSSSHQFSYYDSSVSSWKSMAGGVSYTYYCYLGVGYGTPVCTDAGGSQGYCPSGYTQKLALGAWGTCSYGGCSVCPYFLPPGGSCGVLPGMGSQVFGQAYVCSQ